MRRLSTLLSSALTAVPDHEAVVVPATGDTRTAGQLLEGAARWGSVPGIADHVVVAHMAKSAEYYELAVGAFLHGWSFCPLDTSNPPERLRRVVEQFEHPIVVLDADNPVADEVASWGVTVVTAGDRAPSAPSSVPEATAQDARYYIATSGTTGQPKLVEVRHDATIPFVEWAVPFYEVDSSTRWSQFSSIGFDLSVVDILVCLIGGGTLVAVSTMAERARLHRFAVEQRLTHWHSVPSMVPNLVRGGALPDLRLASFCGEPLLRATCAALRESAPQARLVNTYGPTEGPLFCTHHEITDDDLVDESLSTMPIGRANPGYTFQLIPDDEDGALRLVVCADELAVGYHGLDDPAFSTSTIDGVALRTFDTGDYMVRRGDHLCFSHRRDGQVKLAGVRLDLGDVANACARAGLVQPAVVLHDQRLVVFHEGMEGHAAALDEQRRLDVVHHLRTLLPVVAVPSDFRFLPTLPHNLSGKIDRNELLRLAAATDE